MSDVLLRHKQRRAAVKSDVILDVQELKVHFPVYGGFLQREVGTVKAVDGVSFQLHEGETLGLVGESGCGKSTTGLAILRMLPITSGKIVFEGVDITEHDPRQMRPVRRRVQMVYQDPFGSLDPRMTIGDIIGEPLEIHKLHGNKAERRARVMDLLKTVGLRQDMIDRYPHQFSGGQRQRVSIARALAVEPRLLLCDEPVSALDVSIQAQVVNLFQELQEELGISTIFVAHDLAVVRHVSHRLAVMYLGTIVEISTCDELYAHPKHPYTQALMAAIPVPNPVIEAGRSHQTIQGEVPSAQHPPGGCRFHPRCPHAMPICKEQTPKLLPQGSGLVACHLFT
ncbi:ATP-binding cassette domain-containing protein [Bradyrhizobium sp. 38]|uniref:ABC transporter ATP-binding protein n=1 Tax=unclassified Bradyrhizobium TaxID=2631580 RepID=UPI001FFA28BA|nr:MULTISPECIES: oligopeptide/dipeptide ABC transporter ATP-binding protein [unclassified Bradyrhizobium]MCK1334605.1 ATP-binding cassette domain-containing protein [Bradyrhizobium sp. 38]MCK1778153.1 ATP-binding cassette domain-containing protein [Bradyrhizobium sp. 132]